jgi:hypothetical protein
MQVKKSENQKKNFAGIDCTKPKLEDGRLSNSASVTSNAPDNNLHNSYASGSTAAAEPAITVSAPITTTSLRLSNVAVATFAHAAGIGRGIERGDTEQSVEGCQLGRNSGIPQGLTRIMHSGGQSGYWNEPKRLGQQHLRARLVWKGGMQSARPGQPGGGLASARANAPLRFTPAALRPPAAGAQTERRCRAGPVRGLLGARTSQGTPTGS